MFSQIMENFLVMLQILLMLFFFSFREVAIKAAKFLKRISYDVNERLIQVGNIFIF